MTDPAGGVATAPWALGPFTRHPGVVVAPAPELTFHCPVTDQSVAWVAKDAFNPGAVVHEGRVHLLVRGEDREGRYAGVSRIGLATSADGLTFELEPEPVIFPADDRWQAWEWPGGCEDPRVVESPDGGFVCTYTAFDGKNGALCVATSSDLRTWTKHGPAFAGTPSAKRTSKSGAVLTEVVDGRLVAALRDGRYWMYWGEGTCLAATSTDLVRWTPVTFDATADRYLAFEPETASWGLERVPGQQVLKPLLFPRRGRFDSLLVEPGPPAVATDQGIVLVYNGANHFEHGDPTLPAFAYQPGQALFDAADPTACIARATAPSLRPEVADEQHGQVDNVCFAQGLVLFHDTWHLYFGMADSKIGCATAPL
ncbi:glycoside hydrolase family 130 protein [soil metagenome]